MKLSSLRELAVHGVPFEFEQGDSLFTCISVYFEDAAVLVDSNIKVVSALETLYNLPTACLHPYLMQSLHGDQDIRPVVLFRFKSEEDAVIYCTRHDYKIIKKLDAEKI